MAAPCQSLNPCEDDFNLSDEEDLNSPFPDELQCFAVVTVAELERAGYKFDFKHLERFGWGRFPSRNAGQSAEVPVATHKDHPKDCKYCLNQDLENHSEENRDIKVSAKNRVPPRPANFYTRKAVFGENGEKMPDDPKCTVCGKQFQTVGNARRHWHTHRKNTRFPCDEKNCNKDFASVGSLRDHKKQVHSYVRLQCEYCPKKFKSRSGLSRHKSKCQLD